MSASLPCLPECPPPGLHLSGGRRGGLTHRYKTFSLFCVFASLLSPVGAAADQPGFLQDILTANPLIKQQVSALASRNYQDDLTFCEVVAVTDSADSAQTDFKRALQDLAIATSGAHGQAHTVLVKWKDTNSAPQHVSTTYRVGFYPPELLEAFLAKTKAAMHSDAGLSLLGCKLTVVEIVPRDHERTEPSYRFYAPIPPGWTDEQLMQAMIEQAGLDFDHVLNFGLDLRRGTACNAPTGDIFFNFAPIGCTNHGASMLNLAGTAPQHEILQPPSRFFVRHPDTGIENHIKVRKAAACQNCWGPPRHDYVCAYKGFCKMCLIAYDDMEAGGKRHACGQGDMYRPRAASAPSHPPPLLIPGIPAPPSSELSAKLKAKQLENLARAKRQHAQLLEQDTELGGFLNYEDTELGNHFRVDLGTKAPKRNVTDSPGHAGTSPDASTHL